MMITFPDGSQVDSSKLEIWSCNPADIPPWTPEDKARLVKALGEIFNWEDTKNNQTDEAANDESF